MDEPLVPDDDLDLSVPRRTKFGVALLVVALQVLLAILLVRAFTPDFAAKVVSSVMATFSVTVTTPPLPLTLPGWGLRLSWTPATLTTLVLLS